MRYVSAGRSASASSALPPPRGTEEPGATSSTTLRSPRLPSESVVMCVPAAGGRRIVVIAEAAGEGFRVSERERHFLDDRGESHPTSPDDRPTTSDGRAEWAMLWGGALMSRARTVAIAADDVRLVAGIAPHGGPVVPLPRVAAGRVVERVPRRAVAWRELRREARASALFCRNELRGVVVMMVVVVMPDGRDLAVRADCHVANPVGVGAERERPKGDEARDGGHFWVRRADRQPPESEPVGRLRVWWSRQTNLSDVYIRKWVRLRIRSAAVLSFPGGECRLQTCRGLTAQLFDSTYAAKLFLRQMFCYVGFFLFHKHKAGFFRKYENLTITEPQK